MKPSDILLDGANRILEHGLWKGEPLHEDSPNEDMYCVMLSVTLGRRWNVYEPALHYLYRAAGVTNPEDLYRWNDAPSTTEPMVLGVLHEAALLAKEDGQ